MKLLKFIKQYFLWTILSLLLGFTYTLTLLGAIKIPKKGLSYLLYLFYQWGVIYIGLIVGFIIGLLYILVDVFYLKNKLKNATRPALTRFGVLLAIVLFVWITHYILEKVIDII